MPMYTEKVSMRAGATPQTFDGAQTARFNEHAQRLTGISLGQSTSAYTTDEGTAMAVRLSNNAAFGSKNPVFFMGFGHHAGPTTNHAPYGVCPDYLPLDIPIAANTTCQVDITTVAGATQTGTHDVVITLHYDSNDTPADILYAAAGGAGVVPVKGGSYGYTTALATTTETALTGNGGTLNIPAEANEIVATCTLHILDTAVTQLEELGGTMRFEFGGIASAGKQEFPASGGHGGIGTEVEGGAPFPIEFTPMYIPCPAQEVQVSGYFTALSAITGGADVATNILYR